MNSIQDSTSSNVSKSRSMENVANTLNNASKYILSIEEINITSTVLRRGYLKFLEEKGTDWIKRFVVLKLTRLNIKIKIFLFRLYDDHLHLCIITKKILLYEISSI